MMRINVFRAPPAMAANLIVHARPEPWWLACTIRRQRAFALLIAALALVVAAPSAMASPYDAAHDADQQADGKVIAVGQSCAAGNDCRFALARYTTAGALDASYGGDGRLLGPTIGNWSLGYSAARQADGKLVVAGVASFATGTQLVLQRYLPDGKLDGPFGTNGVVTDVPVLNYGDNSVSAAIDPTSGDTVVGASNWSSGAGFLLRRFSPSGAADSTFDSTPVIFEDPHDGTNGTDDGLQEFGHLFGIAIQSDGKIVAVGDRSHSSMGNLQSSDWAVVRYNADGTPDSGFGSGGKVFVHYGTPSYQGAQAVRIDSRGRIVLAGYCACQAGHPGGPYNATVARLTASGALDATFGDGGFRLHPGSLDRDMALQGDAPLATTGFTTSRLTSGGNLDASYGTAGSVTDDFGSPSDSLAVSALANGGDLVAGTCQNCVTSTTSGDFALAEHGSTGAAASRFGSGGRVTTDFGGAPAAQVGSPDRPGPGPGPGGTPSGGVGSGGGNRPSAQPFKIRVIGDSVAAGFGLRSSRTDAAFCASRMPTSACDVPDGAYGRNVANRLASAEVRDRSIDFINFAVAGSQPRDWLRGDNPRGDVWDLQPRLNATSASQPDLVLVTLGANDLLKDKRCALSTDCAIKATQGTERDMRGLLTRLRDGTNATIVATLYYSLETDRVGAVAALNNSLIRAATGLGPRVLLARLPSFRTHQCIDHSGGSWMLGFGRDLCLHPNDQGQRVIAQGVLDTLRGLTRRRAAVPARVDATTTASLEVDGSYRTTTTVVSLDAKRLRQASVIFTNADGARVRMASEASRRQAGFTVTRRLVFRRGVAMLRMRPPKALRRRGTRVSLQLYRVQQACVKGSGRGRCRLPNITKKPKKLRAVPLGVF